MFDSAHCGGVDPNDINVDMSKFTSAYDKNNPKKFIKRTKVEIINAHNLVELQVEVNNFLASVCNNMGFELHSFRWDKDPNPDMKKLVENYKEYVGTISYSYMTKAD